MPVSIKNLTKHDVARMMDLAILAPDWTDKHQLVGCDDCRKYPMAAYYVLPHWTPLVVSEIGDLAKQQGTLIGTGISFPYGSATTMAKLSESEDQIKIGCTVLDMVANIAWLKDRKFDLYQKECELFVRLCHDAGLVAKVIIQVGLLTNDEIRAATEMVAASGAEYVKTATGTGPVGRPHFADVQLMLDTLAKLNTSCKLKVSGVVDPKVINAYAFIRMGAKLIGTRSAVEIIEALPAVQQTLFTD